MSSGSECVQSWERTREGSTGSIDLAEISGSGSEVLTDFPIMRHRITLTFGSDKQTPCPESASELYRPSDLRLSAKLVPRFADTGVSRSQRGGSPTAVISVF
jgi:hypothetical protein